MDPTNPNATKTASITVGPGKAVAIAGSDCFFGDNFTFHTLVKWTVQLQGCQVALTVPAFRQTDPRWSADELGFGPYTIGGRGCAVSSLAMAQKFAGIESVFSPRFESLTPGSLNRLLKFTGGGQGYTDEDNLQPATAMATASAVPCGQRSQTY